MVSLHTLATAIASQLDGIVKGVGNGPDDAPQGSDIAWIDLQHEREGLRVVLRRGAGSEATRVRATMSLTGAAKAGASYRDTPDVYKLETAAAMSRGADVIARQIESKIVQPAVPMLEEWNTKKAKGIAQRAELLETVARYQAAFPTATISVRDDWDAAEASVSLFNRQPNGGYISGRLYWDGRFYIDRMSAVPEAAAVALLSSVLA